MDIKLKKGSSWNQESPSEVQACGKPTLSWHGHRPSEDLEKKWWEENKKLREKVKFSKTTSQGKSTNSEQNKAPDFYRVCKFLVLLSEQKAFHVLACTVHKRIVPPCGKMWKISNHTFTSIMQNEGRVLPRSDIWGNIQISPCKGHHAKGSPQPEHWKT